MQPTTNVGITRRARRAVTAILNHALAEELLLSSMTRGFSGSVPHFHSLHRLFADQYREMERWVDQLAARIWAVGAGAPGDGSFDELAAARGLTLPEGVPAGRMVSELLALHEQIAGRLREDAEKCSRELGDPRTADVLSHLLEFHETTAWLLRTVLQGAEPARV